MDKVLLESWDRNVRIMTSLASLINDQNRKAKSSEDGWPLDLQLCHIHGCRRGFLSMIAPEHAARLGRPAIDRDGEVHAVDDLDEVKRQFALSGQVVGEVLSEMFAKGVERVEPYDHPIYFLQHMIWHEGWHAGLIMLALRLNGEEPDEVWEERNLWGVWRDPEV